MKVLYIGVFDHTGYGHAATDYALALDSVGVDVVCRRLILSKSSYDPPERLKELLGKSSAGCDVVIQHMLPHQMDFNGNMKNIGLFEFETSWFGYSAWGDRLNCMDEVWVPNKQMVDACRKSGVNRPVKVVPHTKDMSIFSAKTPVARDSSDFTFYFIGELNRRKNLYALLRAFYSEFSEEESVRLVVKTSAPGMSEHDCTKQVDQICNDIKKGMKVKSCPNVHVISRFMSDDEIQSLHESCDCFVMPSFGEAWSLPAFDAMAYGKTPIATACTGFLDYLDDESGWLVNCREEPAFGMVGAAPDLYTSDVNWWSIDVLHLRQCMREAFSDGVLRREKALSGRKRAHEYSYQNVGTLMKEILTGLR